MGEVMGSINFQNALGGHADALLLRAKRSEVLANNLANADTPGFKARDFDFTAVLKGEMKKHGDSLPMQRTEGSHIKGLGTVEGYMQFVNSSQPSIDGNTVDDHLEHAKFTENALAYNSTFEFLNSKFKGLIGAIRGE
jgi:flagellar basal-body rod protein FlgB